MSSRVGGVQPPLAELVKADPVIEVGHVKEDRDDCFLRGIVVFHHEGPFERHL